MPSGSNRVMETINNYSVHAHKVKGKMHPSVGFIVLFFRKSTSEHPACFQSLESFSVTEVVNFSMKRMLDVHINCV